MATWEAVSATVQHGASSVVGMLGKEGATVALHTALIGHPAPLVKVLAAAALAALVAFVLGTITKNYSWVDKSWSILPVYYAYTIVAHNLGGEIHPRLLIAAALIAIWGVRLTYNFYRKGGYAWSGEDYRWEVVQKWFHPALWHIFNLVFIAIAQEALLAALLSPIYAAWSVSYGPRGSLAAPLNALDAVATVLCAFFIVFETVADQQQWNYQTAKHAAKAKGGRLSPAHAKGFLDTGLFRYSRHPNFFAEQAFWWSMCLFATAATGRWVGWWLGGAVALTALFQGSTGLTEDITAGKYPAYAAYQASTSRLLPWFPGTAPVGATRAAAVASPRRRASVGAAAAVAAEAELEKALKEEEKEEKAPSRGRSASRSRASSSAKKPAAAPRSRSASASKKTPSAAKKAAAAPKKVVEATEAEAPAPSRGRSKAAAAPKAASAPASRSRSASAPKKAAAAKKAAEAAPAPSRSRSASAPKKATTAAKKTAAAAPKNAAEAPAPRRSTRARRA